MAKVLSPTVQRSVEDASYDQSLCYNSIKSDASYPRSDGAGGTPMSYLPPGPRWTVWQTIAFARDPFGTVLRYARRYGDPFTLKLPPAHSCSPGPLRASGRSLPPRLRHLLATAPHSWRRWSVNTRFSCWTAQRTNASARYCCHRSMAHACRHMVS